MAEETLISKVINNENQSLSKGVLIVAGTTLISAGIPFCANTPIVGLMLVSLGVFCLVFRELIKLRK